MTDDTLAPPKVVPAGSLRLDNAKYEAFAMAYAVHKNATRAATEAGYSAKTAYAKGHDLLKIVEIDRRWRWLQEERFRSFHMGENEILARLSIIARFNLGRITFVTENGDPYIDLSKATEEDFAALEACDIEDFVDARERDDQGEVIRRDVRRVKVKSMSALKALELLMKQKGMLKEVVEVGLTDDFAERMVRARKRVRDGR